MKKVCLIILLSSFLSPWDVNARLGDSVEVSQRRYGLPVTSAADKVNPIMKDLLVETYNYKGWTIKAAYLNNHTVRILYGRKPQPDLSPFLQDYELDAILNAEAHGGTWTRLRKKSIVEEAFLPTKHPNKMFVHAQKAWLNTNGCIAYTPNGMSLYIDTPDATKWETTMSQAKVEKRKLETPDF